MKKDQVITAVYILASLGLFVLAIDMWICGGEAFCRSSNSLSSKIAKAAITINLQNPSPSDPEWSGWSGPNNPNFDINFSGSQVQVSIPNDGDGDGDGH
ncbi:hypothetical protein GW756_03955 [bacterium]|nr:hypothetical protein [bacterium]NCQ55244.1 hypothetical protein [Candidatus Parcubacteria bacterium]NCS67243.1 hypothetical protein [Candidatus Peregrinibacteria bacterium]NCS96498.1 hypothetical protein [bacterium]